MTATRPPDARVLPEVAPRPHVRRRRLRSLVMSVLAAACLLWMLASMIASWTRALPGASVPASQARLVLAPGQSVWQTLYLPLCAPRRVTLMLSPAIAAPGALHAAWFRIEGAGTWTGAPVHEATAILAPGETRVTFEVPPAALGRLSGLRLTGDRAEIGLPVTRDDLLPRGYVTRRLGYTSADDLVFAGEDRTQAWRGAVDCAARAQPPLLQGEAWLPCALLGVALAGAWIAGLVGRS